jgi:hypothetical protein
LDETGLVTLEDPLLPYVLWSGAADAQGRRRRRFEVCNDSQLRIKFTDCGNLLFQTGDFIREKTEFRFLDLTLFAQSRELDPAFSGSEILQTQKTQDKKKRAHQYGQEPKPPSRDFQPSDSRGVFGE